MDVQLYAQLHGMVQAVKKVKAAKPQEMDDDIEESISELLDQLVEQEEGGYQEGLESFAQHENKIRQQTGDAIRDFLKLFQRGFTLISDALKDQGVEVPSADEKIAALYEKPEEIEKALQEGKAIYELLGFSGEAIDAFYRAAALFIEERQFEKGRDAFFFLTALNGDSAHFWLALAICTTQLKEYEPALDATIRAIQLDPTNPDSYINGLHLCVETNDLVKANEICEMGKAFARDHATEQWAEELMSKLEEAENYINTKLSK